MPIEHHRLVGRGNGKKADGRPISTAGEIVPLRMAERTPDLPAQIMEDSEGAALWGRVWDRAITWISPQTDIDAVIEACRLADDLAVARNMWRETYSPEYARTVVAFSKRLDAALSVLGFNPTARSRLGVAEVKKASALQQMMERRSGA